MDVRKGSAQRLFTAFIFLFLSSLLPAENAITLDARLGFNGAFVISAATPLRVRITNSGSPVKGDLFIETLDQHGRLLTRVSQPLELPRDAKKEVPFTVFFGSAGERLRIGFTSREKTLLRKDIDPGRRRYSRPLVLVAGTGGTFDFLLDVPAVRDKGYPVVHIHPEDLPNNSFDYSGVAVLILYGDSPESLDPVKRKALETWVDSGGTLFVSYRNGSSAFSFGETRGSSLLPVQPAGPRIFDGLDLPLVRGNKIILPGPLPVLTTLPDTGGLPVHGFFGEGRVFFLPFDALSSFSSIEDAVLFWQDLLEDAAAVIDTGDAPELQDYPLIILREEMRGFPGRGITLVWAIFLVTVILFLLRYVYLHPSKIHRLTILFPSVVFTAAVATLTLFYLPGRPPRPMTASFSLLQGTSAQSFVDVRTETLLFSPSEKTVDLRFPRDILFVPGDIPVFFRHEKNSSTGTTVLEPWRKKRLSTMVKQPNPLEVLAGEGKVEIRNLSPYTVKDLCVLSSGLVFYLGDLAPGKRMNYLHSDGQGVALRPESGAFPRPEIVERALKDSFLTGLMMGGQSCCLGWIEEPAFSGEMSSATWDRHSLGMVLLEIKGGF
ncbi:MAG: hypothetical protein JW760_00075 [Spirochaetales bacterium]|nr:hypothetical protein [Spirochaetales bacterium]